MRQPAGRRLNESGPPQISDVLSGWHAANADNREHHQPAESYPSYLTTGHFMEVTAKNWESEFLQMSGYVFLTAFLRQRGSPESKPFEDPRQAHNREDVPWPVRRGGLVLTVYEHSFALVLFAIFLACSLSTRRGAAAEFNQEQLAHGQQTVSVGPFLTASQFWFQSFQNWQSEFFVSVRWRCSASACASAAHLNPSRWLYPTARPGQASKLSFSAALSLRVPRIPNLAV